MNFTHPEFLIEADELAARIDAPSLRLFDATVSLVPANSGYRAESGLARYQAAHLPGAAFMDLIRAFADTSSGLGFTLPAPDALGHRLGAAGIGHDAEIVVYSTGHLMWATRAFWMLRYAGHDNVRVLNGGFAAWQALGLPVESGERHYPPTTFEPRIRAGMFVDLPGMQAALGQPGVCTVNALSPEVYAGTGAMHYGRRGHIPGSRNLHYDRLLEGDRFAGPERIEQTLRAAGLLDAPRVVAYCGGGISATIDAFACLLMGHDDVAVYDGSMAEWVRDPSLPLTLGESP